MSNVAVQAILVAVGGLVLLVVVFLLARRGLLSLRYALGWMAVSLVLLGGALILALMGGISHSLPITPTGLLSAIGLAFVLAVCLQLSISLSGHQEAIRQLSESTALLDERLKRVQELMNTADGVHIWSEVQGVQLRARPQAKAPQSGTH
jgi:hypothetical protein